MTLEAINPDGTISVRGVALERSFEEPRSPASSHSAGVMEPSGESESSAHDGYNAESPKIYERFEGEFSEVLDSGSRASSAMGGLVLIAAMLEAYTSGDWELILAIGALLTAIVLWQAMVLQRRPAHKMSIFVPIWAGVLLFGTLGLAYAAHRHQNLDYTRPAYTRALVGQK